MQGWRTSIRCEALDVPRKSQSSKHGLNAPINSQWREHTSRSELRATSENTEKNVPTIQRSEQNLTRFRGDAL